MVINRNNANTRNSIKINPSTQSMELSVINDSSTFKGNQNQEYHEQEKSEERSISYLSVVYHMYKYSDTKDVILMTISIMAAIINGMQLSISSLCIGQLVNIFLAQIKYAHDPRYKTNTSLEISRFSPVPYSTNYNELPSDFISEEAFFASINNYVLTYLCIGIISFISGFILTSCSETSCSNRIRKLKEIYFTQILRQDLSWYDNNVNGDLITKITDDIESMRNGLGSKIPLAFHLFATLLSAIITGLLTCWRLAIILLIGGQVILISTGTSAKIAADQTQLENIRYGLAGKIANEVISNIKTITAFDAQKNEIERFDKALADGTKAVCKKYYWFAIAFSISIGSTYFMYAVGIWYGSVLYLDQLMTLGDMITVFVSILSSALIVSNALPLLTEIGNAMGSAVNVFSTISNNPKIDPLSTEGKLLENIEGKIEFNEVQFCYPSRTKIMVLSNLNLVIQPGQVIALVGASGSGKSTTISLLQRFYDPISGEVLIDDVNIKQLNVTTLRKKFGVVSQEPVLFDVTIKENIRYGHLDATDQEIIDAAKLANVHDFITSLPNGYESLVGERGSQLSGGLKQRIAIARALVSNPRILLLDEATSALDAQSESAVQTALDNAVKGRTTIIIAHRLSTIKKANLICAMKDGKIVESGTHGELMFKKGLYHNLVTNQNEIITSTKLDNIDTVQHIESISKKENSLIRRSTGSVSNNVQAEERIQKEESQSSFLNLLKTYLGTKNLLIVIVLCILGGSHLSVFIVLYGQVFWIYTDSNIEFEKTILFVVGELCTLAVATTLVHLVLAMFVCTLTEKMIKDFRLNIFKNLLTQAVGLFDDEDYSPSNMINLLSRDPPIIRNIAGVRAAVILKILITLLFTLGNAFYYTWQLALIFVVFMTIKYYATWNQGVIKFGSFKKESIHLGKATKLASECVQNIKTVQSLCLQEHMVDTFTKYLAEAQRIEKSKDYIYGLDFALSVSLLYLVYAINYWYGATLISQEELSFTDLYRVILAVAFSVTSFVPTVVFFLDFGKAKVAIASASKIIYIESELNPFSKEGIKRDIKGKLEFNNVWFSYPTRKQETILRGLDLTIEPGQTVALVGSSGSGKSTIISLLERFYFPDKGNITLDGVDIAEINIGHLRNNLGLVTQEPILFDTTIRENIEYGAKSLGQQVTEQDVIQAAKAANIHDFIISLPQGYDTKVGERGSKISGGQKQRIAIARALIRNPKILLLDEATSALDTESERIVKAALDKAREGRTCIIIAHRLSTIQNADKIAVIHNGLVVEQGTHKELKALGGLYFELFRNQCFYNE